MKQRSGTYSSVRKTGAVSHAIAICALLALAGCANDKPRTTGAIDTGTFPNLNIRPATAAAQLTEADKAAIAANVGAAQSAQVAAAAVAPPADPAAIRKIGAEHGEETLKAISAQK